jgi:hypothetical protein
LASGRSISLEARAAGLYRFCQTLIAECDQELAKLLRAFPDRSAGVALAEETRKGRRKKKRGNSPQFDLRQLLYLMSGVDLARIDGIDVITAMTVVAEAATTSAAGQRQTILFPGCGLRRTTASVAIKSSAKAGLLRKIV